MYFIKVVLKLVGFKFKYEELSSPYLKEATDYVASEKDIKVIHLKRENLWQRYKSGYIACNITKQFNSTDGRIQIATDKKFPLVATEIEKSFNQTNAWVNQYSKLFEGHRSIDLTYEDFKEFPQESFNSVCDFLEIDRVVWKPRTKKIEKISDDELFSNMNEIKDYFAKTKYSKFFINN